MTSFAAGTFDYVSSAVTTGLGTPPESWVPTDYLWTLIYGFVIAFILAFAVGANDVANSFGTTVGAKVVSLRTACILASIFETLGAVFLGAKVGETIRKGIIDVTIYNYTESGTELLLIGEVSAMTGAAVWQLIATVLGLPVSGTHSIVGACIGFSIVAVGPSGVNWTKLGFIIASWFISPVLSGVMAVSLYIFVKKVILEKHQPLKNGLRCLPFFYAFTFGINCLSISYIGAPLLGLDTPLWAMLLATLVLMAVVAVIVQLTVVPRLRRKAKKELTVSLENSKPLQTFPPYERGSTKCIGNNNSPDANFGDAAHQSLNHSSEKQDLQDDLFSDDNYDADKSLSSQDLDEKEDIVSEKHSYDLSTRKSVDKTAIDIDNENDDDSGDDPVEVRTLFSTLQILTACFGSFAHGGNDVSNAIGPLIALWLIYHSGEVVQSAMTPWYLLLYGGLGIVAGLWILGRRVIKTIGSDLTKLTPSRGFCVELMTAFTVLIASNIGIPVSTTHCKVGSVVSIGWFRSRSAVTWSTVRNIAVAWFVTVPVSGLISAGVMHILLLIVR